MYNTLINSDQCEHCGQTTEVQGDLERAPQSWINDRLYVNLSADYGVSNHYIRETVAFKHLFNGLD